MVAARRHGSRLASLKHNNHRVEHEVRKRRKKQRRADRRQTGPSAISYTLNTSTHFVRTGKLFLLVEDVADPVRYSTPPKPREHLWALTVGWPPATDERRSRSDYQADKATARRRRAQSNGRLGVMTTMTMETRTGSTSESAAFLSRSRTTRRCRRAVRSRSTKAGTGLPTERQSLQRTEQAEGREGPNIHRRALQVMCANIPTHLSSAGFRAIDTLSKFCGTNMGQRHHGGASKADMSAMD